MERVKKVQVGWEKSENANQVYSFIWHPRVTGLSLAIRPLWDILVNSCLIVEVWQ